MTIVRDPNALYKCAYMSEFMKNLNQILHDDRIKVDDVKQREIFKVMTIVTMR